MHPRTPSLPNRLLRLTAALGLLATTIVWTAEPASAAILIVNSTADVVDLLPGDGICDTGNTVGLDPECTLRAAIQEANLLAGADTITLPAGTYTLSIGTLGEDAATQGDLDIASDITIDGAGAGTTIIQAGTTNLNGIDRVFDVLAGGVLDVSDVTIRYGREDDGAGIQSIGTVIVEDAIVAENTAAKVGGGINLKGSGTSLTVRRTQFLANSADDGGGVGVKDGTSLIENSTFSANTASRRGGGIHNDAATATITRSTFVGNSALTDDGGGILNRGGGAILNLTNSTLSGNSAVRNGGGLSNESTVALLNVTITANTASDSGGGVRVGGGTVTAKNTIVAGNTTGGNCSNLVTSQGYNLEDTDTCGFNQTGDQKNTNPQLGPLADNGGPTQTFTLLAGSPAIDAGDDTACVAPNNDTDQRGDTRPIDYSGDAVGPFCDVGAYEAAAPPPPTVPMAVWRTNGSTAPRYNAWDGSAFTGTQTSQSVGGWRIIQGAEAPSRDEAIVIGVDEASGDVTGEMWNGSAWNALSINPLGNMSQTYWWGFDVAYEPISGDAVVVSTDGANVRSWVWDGGVWTGPQTLTLPIGGTPRQVQVAAHPYEDEMVLIVSNSSSQDYAFVWNGGSWGTSVTLDAVGGGTPTAMYATYEQQSGRALVAFGVGDDDVHYRFWDGAAWDAVDSVLNGIGGGYVRWLTLGSDPNSDNVALGAVTIDADVWLATWNGSGWNDETTATTATTGTNHPSVAVAFEGTSGEAVAVYGEAANTPRYRTWSSGSGWSGTELSTPTIGANPNSMMLYPEPGADGMMLVANDALSDLHYLYWNGGGWGTDNELETESGDDKNQPFLFLWGAIPATPPATYSISGTVFDDITGDVLNDGVIGDANNPGVPNVDVHLYVDGDGDGVAEATDTFVATATTDVNGDYSFAGQSNGKYFVVVDSLTVQPSAGIDTLGGWLATDVWAEQTYAAAISECADGAGGTVDDPTPGPCYGGRRAGVSDNLATWYSGAEHLAKVGIASGNVGNVDFGFSFNVATTTAGGDGQDDDPAATLRSVQGSLRQFIYNANATLGTNTMRFVPAGPTNATDGANDWWRVAATNLLPAITGDGTTVDGRAFDLTDGVTVLDPNTAQIGSGLSVGTAGTYTTPKLDPELEIWNDRGTTVLPTGLVFEADDSVLRHVSIWGFGDAAGAFDANVRFGTNFNTDPDFTGSLVEFNVIGTGPASLTDPGAIDRSGQANLTMRETDNAIVRDNLIGFAGGTGVNFSSASNSGSVLRNEIRRNGILNPIGNPVGVWVSGTVTGNLVIDNASGIFSGPTSMIQYLDNTITLNGWGAARPNGIHVYGSSTIIQRNVIGDNYGAGVVVQSTVTNSVITRNSFFGNGTGNGQVGIDLLKSGDDPLTAPYVTLNDDGDADLGANNLLNYPVLDKATVVGTDLVVTGWVKAGGGVEFYLANPDPSGFGEGETWLITMVEGSVDDTDGDPGSYGPGAVNGLLQGEDTTTERFEFTIPVASLAAPVVAGDQLTAMTFSFTTSEFGGNVTVAGPIAVNSTGNLGDLVPGDGVCDTGGTVGADPECTLRAAIDHANATAGDDVIHFDIPVGDSGHSGGVWTITPSGSALPPLSTTITIDGTTQPGWTTTPVIEVDGNSLAGTDGLSVTGDNVAIRSLAIGRFDLNAIYVAATAAGTTIAGNHLGTDASGLLDRGNFRGIDLSSGSGPTTVGGTNDADRNVVSGNTDDGMVVWQSSGNTIIGNYFGTDVTGNAPLPNDQDGVALGGTSSNNTIGQVGAGNVFSGNARDGLELDNNLTGNVIQANIIGLGEDGTTVVANGRHGLVLYDGVNNTLVGGTGVGEGNVISGNTETGVIVDANGNAATTANTIAGNYIGTDAGGTLDKGNGSHGIHLFSGATGNTTSGNLISGNTADGVRIIGAGSDGNTVTDNYIGTNAAGTAKLANGGNGVDVLNGASGNFIGLAGAGNLISGNNGYGVDISGVGTDSNTVAGNNIGTDAAGTADLGNATDGVAIRGGAQSNTVGGVTAAHRNIISGNDNDGIWITGSGTDSNVVQGNWIGFGSDDSSIGNSFHGVAVENDASYNLVGGTLAAHANRIGNSAWDGVAIAGGTGTGNAVIGNSIVDNTGLGIDFENDGITPNDLIPGDGDSGPNGLLNFPEILSATESGGTVTLTGVFDVPQGEYRIEFFKNPSGADPSGNGEGEAIAGSAPLSHTAFVGDEPWGATFSGVTGDIITATITECTDAGCTAFLSTSEFSAAVTVTSVNTPPVANDNANGVAEDGSAVFNVKANDTDAEDGIPSGPAAVVAQPLHGTAVANAGGMGTITYTPDPDFFGSDTLTYTIDDSGGLTSNVATVTITVAGSDDPPTAADDGPYSVLEDGSLVVGAQDRQFSLSWGSAGAGNGQFAAERGIAVAPDGSIYIADTGNDRVQKFDAAGTYLLQWGSSGTGNGQFDTPMGVAVAPDGTVYVSDLFNDRIQYFDPTGVYLGQFGATGTGDGQLDSPRGMDFGPDGNLYVADAYNYRIQVFTPSGTYLRQWGSSGTGNGQFDAPRDLVVDALGDVYVADSFNDRIQKFDSSGAYLLQWGTSGAADGQFSFPRSIEVNAAGDIFVSDSFNDRVQIFDSSGTFLSAFGTSGTGDGQFTATYGLAFGPNGDLYVGDVGNNRVQRFAPIGIFGNDTDPDFPLDTLTATVDTDVANGTLALAPDGTFTYTPDPDYFGPDSFVYQVCDTSPACDTATVTIIVGPVNDEPSFTAGVNVGLSEDNGPVTIPGWATAITAGPANESGQTLTFSITGNTNPGLFSTGPAIDSATGNLSFTPAAQAFGAADITVELQDNGGTADGGDDTSTSAVFTITVTSVNDAPSFTAGAAPTVDEDSGPYSAGWASVISAGPANESGQTVSFNVTGNTNPGLFSVAPAVDGSGNLTFTPAPHAFGTSDITVEAQDDGGTASGGVDTSPPVVFTITVDPVNDAPAFTPGVNVGFGEDNGPTTVAGWASAMSRGPANEAGQTLTFNTTGNTNPGLFSVGPTLDPITGDLTFTPAADQNGSSVITVELQDNGGTSNGGSDTSPPVNFTITINPQNDAPVLDPVGAQSGDELTLIGFTATASDVDIPADALTFTLEDGSGSVPAGAVITAGGVFTWTPTDAQGGADYTFDVVVTDDGTGLLSDSETITVTVNDTNTAPVLDPVGAQSGDELTPIGFSATASDVDIPADALTFTLEDGSGSVPAGAVITAGGVFTWTPSESQGGVDYTFDVVVTDDGTGLLSDSETITVTVNDTNTAPGIVDPGNQSNAEGAVVALTISGSDLDDPADGLTWSATGLPSGLSIDSGSGEITGTVDVLAAAGSPYSATVRLTDDGTPVLYDEVTFTWTITDTNRPPVLDPVGPQAIDEQTVLIFTATGSDPDGDGFTFTLAGAVPSGAVITAGGVFTWTPTESQGGADYTFDVVVTDDGTGLLSDSETITVTVNDTNTAPVLDPVGAQSGDELTPIGFSATASDVDIPADALTFTLEDGSGSVPAGAVITAGGVFTWTPTESQGGADYSFDVVVTDDGTGLLSDSETITVTVNDTNTAPVLDLVGAQSGDEGTLITFTATASDVDIPVDALTFTLEDGLGSVPAGASITGGGVFTWTPTESQGGAGYSFDVVVTDDGAGLLSDSETITVTVNEVNSAPVANPIGDRFPTEGATVSLTATASDSDVPANVLVWSQDSGPGAVDGAGNYSWLTGETDGPGTYTVVLRVTDDGSPNLDDTVSFDITVAEVDTSPVLNPVGAQSGDEDTLITVTATATDPDVPGSVTFTLEDGAGSVPLGASIAAGGVFTWTPTEAQGPGVYSFDVVVTDNTLLEDRETITVTVNETNIAPILNPLPNPTQSENTFITFTASATDGDVPANTLSYSLVGAPPGATINPASGVFGWIPTEAQGPGIYTFDVVVTDDGAPNLTDTDSVTITVVESNRDPVLDPVGARSGSEGTSIAFTATATDLDQPANLLTFTLEDGPGAVPSGASITSGGFFAWTPSEAQGPGVYTFDVVVADDGVPIAEDRETITVTVVEANVAPSLDPVGPQAGDEGTVIAFTATASDPDLPPGALTFTLGGAPAGAAITAGGIFSWIPNETQGPGIYVFDVVVTDDGAPNLEDRETIVVTVAEVDTAPALNPIGDRLVDEGSLLTFSVTSTDPDVPSNRTYSLEDGPGSVPSGAGIDSLLGLFGWSPSEAQGPGVNTFDVVVTDNTGLQDRETITITVAEINQAPVLDPVGDLTATELVPLTFSATASDPDDPANTLTFSLSGGPAGAAITTSGAFSWTPTEAQGAGTFTFDVVVTDDGTPASADSETITVTVGEVNAAPVLGPIGDRVVDEEALVAFVAVATDPDVPADTLTYSLIGAPAGASIDPAVGAFSWTPTEAQGPGSYSFTFVVTDALGASDSETITMSVAEVNLAPTIVDPGDQVGGEGLAVNLALVGADADEPANLLTWSATGLPDGLAIDPVTGVISGIVAEGAASSSPLAVTIDLADDGSPSLVGTTSFSWAVAVNRPPAATPDFYEVEPGSTLIIGAPGVLGNDVDPDGDILAANLLIPPSAGTLAFAPTGGFTYIHNGGGTVEDVFVYEVDDGRGGLSLATVKISILEPNLPPILTDDLLSILEDGVGSIAPLVNDSDPNGDPLTLIDFTQPDFGLLSASADGTLAFTPPGDFFGEVTSVYTASDGKGGVATGVVSIVVSPVNDLPIGRRDVATLDTYLPFVLDVLGNDGDVDSDTLSVVGVLGLTVGEVAVNPDGTLTYRPAAGFVGTDTFRYQVSDGAGGVDTVSVSITVPEEVLAVAIARGEDIGTPSLGFQAPAADLGEGPSITFGLAQGVSLLADAFFQSLGALQLPILFLGLALGTVVVLGGFTELPMLLATRRRRYYSVVLLGREHRLAARVDAGPEESAVYFYEPTAAGFQSLDKPVRRDSGSWIPVESPNGAGWVEARYLTETVDLEFFLEDERPVAMLRRLALDLVGRKDISSLFSSRGLALALGNEPEIFEPQAFKAALADRYGSEDSSRLWETALEPLGAALRAADDLDLRSSHSRAALIPVELWNFQYLTVNVAGHPPWLVYFEYDKGRPRIVGIGLDV